MAMNQYCPYYLICDLCTQTLLAQAGSVSRYDVPMRGFYSKREGVSRDFITFLQQPIDFRLSTIIKWFQNAKYRAIVDHHKWEPIFVWRTLVVIAIRISTGDSN